MSESYCFKTELATLATLTARTTAPLLQPMLGKASDVVQYTVKPHIPLTHTVPSRDLETPPEPDSLVCLHTSGSSGRVNNKKVQLHSEPCGCQRLPAPSVHRGVAPAFWRPQRSPYQAGGHSRCCPFWQHPELWFGRCCRSCGRRKALLGQLETVSTVVDEGKVTGCGSVVAVATKILRDSSSTVWPDQNTPVLVFLLGKKHYVVGLMLLSGVD